jgi:hypothetical protein
MALSDLILVNNNKKKIGISEERIIPIKPVLR